MVGTAFGAPVADALYAGVPDADVPATPLGRGGKVRTAGLSDELGLVALGRSGVGDKPGMPEASIAAPVAGCAGTGGIVGLVEAGAPAGPDAPPGSEVCSSPDSPLIRGMNPPGAGS